jgi:hypothetical protein
MQGIANSHSGRRLALRPSHVHGALFVLILALGVFDRVWEYRRLPPGLNADEASIGVEAYDLLHWGLDRNGVQYPVHFISWGSGQNALYGYVLLPFVAGLGLSPGVVRLPMLAAGILSLPLMYLVGTDTFDRRLGLLSMFFLAISPWHILLSRWGLESNFLPFVFLAGYVCLLGTRKLSAWLIPACILFGLCLYAYGTSYAVVPVFLLFALGTLAHNKLIGRRDLIPGAAAFVVLAIPIGLLLLVNTFHLTSIRLGPVTIPRFPTQARYEDATVLGSSKIAEAIASNVWTAFRLLLTQSDGSTYNVVDPYGYFYTFTFPIAVAGIVLLVMGRAERARVEVLLLIAWIAASGLIAVFQAVNINRFNIIFMPLLLSSAYFVGWLDSHWKAALPVSIIVLLAAFATFTAAYHGQSYRLQANVKFRPGLLPALQFARSSSANPLCVTDRINMPYIFALFSEHDSPADFLRTVEYVDALAPFRQVVSYGRYIFGTQNCTNVASYTYVLTTEEIPPRLGNRYQYEFFDDFVVYFPRP